MLKVFFGGMAFAFVYIILKQFIGKYALAVTIAAAVVLWLLVSNRHKLSSSYRAERKVDKEMAKMQNQLLKSFRDDCKGLPKWLRDRIENHGHAFLSYKDLARLNRKQMEIYYNYLSSYHPEILPSGVYTPEDYRLYKKIHYFEDRDDYKREQKRIRNSQAYQDHFKYGLGTPEFMKSEYALEPAILRKNVTFEEYVRYKQQYTLRDSTIEQQRRQWTEDKYKWDQMESERQQREMEREALARETADKIVDKMRAEGLL